MKTTLKAKYLTQVNGLSLEYLVFPCSVETEQDGKLFVSPMTGWFPFSVTQMALFLQDEASEMHVLNLLKRHVQNKYPDVTEVQLTEGQLV